MLCARMSKDTQQEVIPMAPAMPLPKEDDTSTRPRLQAINQDFSDLDEQIRQAAQIIGLPETWLHTQDKTARSDMIQHLVRARAEWVLRWILDKLRDETYVGKIARANSSAWQLLDCMMHALPVSRSAPHIRDAHLPTILERTLFESFGTQPPGHLPDSDNLHMRDAIDSTTPTKDENSPSRKRKRGVDGTIPSNKSVSPRPNLAYLFRTLRLVMRTAISLATANDQSKDRSQAELMKMALRTDSAQASRILKFWLTGVYQLIDLTFEDDLDLSLVAEVWDLRTIAADDDAGTSAKEFSTECIVPTLLLLEALQNVRASSSTSPSSASLDRTTQTLEILLARHLLAPSRAAFLVDTTGESTRAIALAHYLAPLRAKLLQAVHSEDAGQPLPAEHSLLLNGVAHLLDLSIRICPSRTLRGRLIEKPWIHASFATLAECAGCSVDAPPDFIPRQTAVAVLQRALRVLRVHNVGLKSDLVKKLFWYYCGVKYPERQEKQIHWSLIASLIELEPSVYVQEPKSTDTTYPEQHSDLVEVIFEQISVAEVNNVASNKVDLLVPEESIGSRARVHADNKISMEKALILSGIIIPLMAAFVQNRNLLGFIRKWDHQLARSYRHDCRKALKGHSMVWEDRTISEALAGLFEQSLTQGQIATLLEEHGERLDGLENAMHTAAKDNFKVKRLAQYKSASSSAVIVPAILHSIKSPEVLEALKPQLHSLFLTYAKWVQEDRFSFYLRLDSSWSTLSQLLIQLWPIELHDSRCMQLDLIHPLLDVAVKDVSAICKKSTTRQTSSATPAAAMVFLFDACDYLQTVPDSRNVIRLVLSRIMESISPTSLGLAYEKMISIFCARFVSLLGHLNTDDGLKALSILLLTLAKCPGNDEALILSSLAHSVYEQGSFVLQNSYAAALLQAIRDDKNEVHGMAVRALLQVNPSALSRETREAVLDRSVDLLDEGHEETLEILALITHLMTIPNATAKICTNGKILFDIASRLGLQKLDTPTRAQHLGRLVHLTLSHILPNHAQPQAMAFITQFSSKVDQIAKLPEQCTPMKLSILRATVQFQNIATLIKLRQYVELLKLCLTEDGEQTASLEDVLDAINELPSSALTKANLFGPIQAWLQIWLKDNADLESYITSESQSLPEAADHAARLHRTAAKFRLYPNTQWLIRFTLKVLRENLLDRTKDVACDAVREALTCLQLYEKLDLVPFLSEVEQPADRAASYHLLMIVITTLDDRLESNAELKQRQLALLPRICTLLADSPDYDCFSALVNCVITILNSKPSLTSQHSIECVLGVLVTITSRSSPPLSVDRAASIFSRLCEVARLILLVHRGRLGGRFHLILPLLQGLLFCLFVPNTSRSGALPAWLRGTGTEPVRLASANATHYSRLLATLCNPPQSSITKAHQHRTLGKGRDLNDPVRAARERVSSFLYPLLTTFCRCTLSGRLDAGVREKLMLGIWEIVGTASLHKENLDAMFAGLGRSERDVWRGVWGEWEGLFGRKGVMGVE